MTKIYEPCGLIKEEKPSVSLRFRIFFDGTLNNKENSLDFSKSSKFKVDNGSYSNDITNIAKLESLLVDDEDADHSIPLYIEGVGTEDGKKDSSYGAGTGFGDYGVIKKVEKCMEKVGLAIEKRVPDKSIRIKYIYFDVFGFSRGAAAARYCIHLILVNTWSTIAVSGWLAKKGYKSGPVKVKYVGLFDTVASYGVKHSNDTSDLKLDSVKNAEKVIQIAAAEEHRKNFRLTNIVSAGTKGKEVFIPGVHSDIGGGYQSGSNENMIVFRANKGSKQIKKELNWLVDSGWYKKNEVFLEDRAEYIPSPGFAPPVRIDYTDIRVKRSGIKNKYSHIPLHLMADFAREERVVFKEYMLRGNYGIPTKLEWLKKEIDAQVKLCITPDYQINNWWINNSDSMKKVRNTYFHFSAYYNASFNAHDPQLKDKKRKRIIQNG